MDWVSVSETKIGLAITGKESLDQDSPRDFAPPYDEMAKIIQQGNVTPERLIKQFDFDSVQGALSAAESVNGLGKIVDWSALLKESAIEYTVGTQMENLGKRLKRGEKVDLSFLEPYLHSNGKVDEHVTCLEDISEVSEPYIPSGYKPVDFYFGGLPQAGLLTIIGYAKTGKTSLIITLIKHFMEKHPEKHVLMISTEATKPEIKRRGVELGITDFARFHAIEHAFDVTTIKKFAEQVDNLGLLVVDILDDLVDGEVSEPKMSLVYQTLAVTSRELEVPLIAMAQPHGGAGKTLRPNNARWSRMAEARSYAVWTLYNPSVGYATKTDTDIDLPDRPGCAWILFWMSRGGFRVKKYAEIAPFAVAIPWTPEHGWENRIHKRLPPVPLSND